MGLNEPKVSVIIPCYNCAVLVKETLDSLSEQTYRHFEVICVNDGSTDETLSVLQHYAEKQFFEMKIVTQANGGVSRARNRGIEEASGDFLLFLDSDDLYHAQFIERMVKPVTEGSADVAYCRLTRDLNDIKTVAVDDIGCQLQSQKEAMDKLLFEMGSYGFYCYIYRRSALMENALRFDVNTRYFEDREFNWKYLCHCSRYAWIDAPLYGYRVTENSAMRKKTTWERCVNSLAAVKRIEQYMESLSCDYLPVLKSYLYQRVMWGVAKNIALSKDRKMFRRLKKEYDVRICMKRTAKDENRLVRIASRMYLICPSLFYRVVGLKK